MLAGGWLSKILKGCPKCGEIIGKPKISDVLFGHVESSSRNMRKANFLSRVSIVNRRRATFSFVS